MQTELRVIEAHGECLQKRLAAVEKRAADQDEQQASGRVARAWDCCGWDGAMGGRVGCTSVQTTECCRRPVLPTQRLPHPCSTRVGRVVTEVYWSLTRLFLGCFLGSFLGDRPISCLTSVV